MSEQRQSKQPYESLGKKLKSLRTKRQESLLEVSGAVEIDSDTLSSYEQGTTRPSEDILALLISYFDIQENDATKIWDIAGYGNMSADNLPNMPITSQQVMFMPMDARIVYTDLVHVVVNNYGVVVNFMQGAGPNSQPMAVSRIGMSKEHARSLLDVLKTTLEQAENPPPPKQLPESSTPKKQTDQKEQ